MSVDSYNYMRVNSCQIMLPDIQPFRRKPDIVGIRSDLHYTLTGYVLPHQRPTTINFSHGIMI